MRIIIVDSSAVVRTILEQNLSKFENVTIISSVSSCQKILKTLISDTPDAVICGNDAVAESIIRSISEHMVEKAIPVAGQDAEISACRRVVKGTQSATVYKPIDDLAKKASEFAVLLGSEKTIPEDLSEQTVFNGSKDVPVYWLEPALVTSSNINEVIIEPGFHTKKEIYR